MTGSVRILLVDDNQADLDLMEELLEGGPLPVELSKAKNGDEALALLRARHSAGAMPSLVLLDLNMPGMDGRAFLRIVKGDSSLRHIPVVIFSSSDAERDITEGYNLGANCYVTKPVGLEPLRNTVSAMNRFWLGVARVP